jgi:AmmeMemoRadiSam system protein A
MKLIPQTNPALFAKEVVKAALENTPEPQPPQEEFYRQQAASFVSIKKYGELRGCIGTLQPSEPDLGHEIIRNARSSAFADPRFPPVVLEELIHLTLSVDVLCTPERVEGMHELDIEMYGVIVSCDYRRGVLLPNLEGVESVEHQLAIACQKAGIAPHEEFEVQRFTVERYGEEWSK